MPSYSEMTETQQFELTGFVIASRPVDAEVVLTEALIESQLLSTLIATQAIDRSSKYSMIELAIMDAMKPVCEVVIYEHNRDYIACSINVDMPAELQHKSDDGIMRRFSLVK